MEKEFTPMPKFCIGDYVVCITGRELILGTINRAFKDLDDGKAIWMYNLEGGGVFDEMKITKYEKGGVVYL